MFQVYDLFCFSIKHTLAGDIYPNPSSLVNSPKFCCWNSKSICGRDKIKITLIEAFNSVFHYDLTASSETNRNGTIHNEEILTECFSRQTFCIDHPSGDKQGGVCIYFCYIKEEQSTLEWCLIRL